MTYVNVHKGPVGSDKSLDGMILGTFDIGLGLEQQLLSYVGGKESCMNGAAPSSMMIMTA